MQRGKLIMCFILGLSGCSHVSLVELTSTVKLVDVAKVQDERQRLRFEVEVQNLGQLSKKLAFACKQDAQNGPPIYSAPQVNISTVEDKNRDIILSFHAEENQFEVDPGASRTIGFEVEMKPVAPDIPILMTCILRDADSGQKILAVRWQGLFANEKKENL